MHLPTDTNLLWDVIRKAIQACATLCDAQDLTEWRQCAHLLRRFKNSYRFIQKLKHSTSHDKANWQIDQLRSRVLLERTQARFAGLNAMSFDKGCHRPAIQTVLKQHMDKLILP